tara:strand:+ start:985 stop:1368 length:384 start_codon:yes stop_codon:yes gene_type:complete
LNEIQQPTLDDKLHKLAQLRGSIKDLQEQEKVLKQEQNELEAGIIAQMKELGIDRAGNDMCTISTKVEVVPTVSDWDAVWQHIFDTRQTELLQKRMSATAFRELASMGQTIPGVSPTELDRLNYRSK